MSDSGSLIQLHYHENFDVIQHFIDKDDVLFYKGQSITPTISKEPNNGLTFKEDGLYVSNLTMLNVTQYNLVSRFSYKNGLLLFDSITVSQEYDKSQIRMMITDLWKDIEDYQSGGDMSDTTES